MNKYIKNVTKSILHYKRNCRSEWNISTQTFFICSEYKVCKNRKKQHYLLTEPLDITKEGLNIPYKDFYKTPSIDGKLERKEPIPSIFHTSEESRKLQGLSFRSYLLNEDNSEEIDAIKSKLLKGIETKVYHT